MRSSLASDLRATATEFVPGRQDTAATENANNTLTNSTLPDMYALDGYGLPWFYHMYPVPWLFPPIFAKSQSRSPKKLRPKKQRSAVTLPVDGQHTQHEVLSPVETKAVEFCDNPPASDRAHSVGSDQKLAPDTTTNIKPSDGPFSTQFDMIARQAALQPSTNARRPPKVDLMTVRNVPTHTGFFQGHVQGYNTVPSQRRNHRRSDNGLYGGRGNVGMPLYATVPFPSPVPPMGRPTAFLNRDANAYLGYTVATKACGTVEIEKAAEHGGAQACNTCEPDH